MQRHLVCRMEICVALSSNINLQFVMMLHFVDTHTGLHLPFALRASNITVKLIFPPFGATATSGPGPPHSRGF
jgi:hypothetical protein